MIERIRNTYASFDPQFWVLFAGTLLNAVGFSFIFPFPTRYSRCNLHNAWPASRNL